MLLRRRSLFISLSLLVACGSSGSTDAGSLDSSAGDSGAFDSALPDSGRDAGPSDSGADAGLTDAGDAGALNRADLPARLAAAYCAAQTPCCELDSTVTSDCEARVAAAVEMLVAPTANREYDAAAAAACVAALEALPPDCDGARAAARTVTTACAGVTNGTLAPGELCESAAFCQRPAGALGDTSTGFVGCGAYGASTERRCRAFVPTHEAGAACEMTFGGDQPTVSVCVRGELYCEAGVCVAVSGLGDSCPSPQACTTDDTCDLASHLCVERGSLGASCLSAACAHGLDCVGDVCVPDAAPRRLFGPCLGSAGCVDWPLACTSGP